MYTPSHNEMTHFLPAPRAIREDVFGLEICHTSRRMISDNGKLTSHGTWLKTDSAFGFQTSQDESIDPKSIQIRCTDWCTPHADKSCL